MPFMMLTIASVVVTLASLVTQLDLDALHLGFQDVVLLGVGLVLEQVLRDDALRGLRLAVLDHALQLPLHFHDVELDARFVAVEVPQHAVDRPIHFALQLFWRLLHWRWRLVSHCL